jgi:hypothetical protein
VIVIVIVDVIVIGHVIVALGRRAGAVPWFGESLFPTMSVPQS